MSRLYHQYICSTPLDYVSDLFFSLGFTDCRELAVEFFAPMFLLYSVYDGSTNKEEKMLETHIGLERQGPGSPEVVEQALGFLKPLNQFSQILDMFSDFIDKLHAGMRLSVCCVLRFARVCFAIYHHGTRRTDAEPMNL